MPIRSDRRRARGAFVAALVAFLALAAGAEEARAQIPDKFTNLQVLPKEIAKPELVGMMRGFADALGVRCAHCHAGPDNLQGTDFASDDKPAKRTAREMMKMVTAINGTYLAAIQTDRERKVEVRCQTCHHGIAVPEPIQEIVTRKLDSGGVEAAKEEYLSLKKEHYGDGAYDFSSAPLNGMAESLFRAKKVDESLAFIDLSLEMHPDDSFTYTLKGGILKAMGKTDEAVAAYKKAIELDPENRWAKKSLAELEGSGGGEEKKE